MTTSVALPYEEDTGQKLEISDVVAAVSVRVFLFPKRANMFPLLMALSPVQSAREIFGGFGARQRRLLNAAFWCLI